MKAKDRGFLMPGVLDVQGKAHEGAVHPLGFSGFSDVRVGRMIEFDIAGTDRAAVEAEVKTLCDRLLANTVIESYRVELI